MAFAPRLFLDGKALPTALSKQVSTRENPLSVSLLHTRTPEILNDSARNPVKSFNIRWSQSYSLNSFEPQLKLVLVNSENLQVLR